ncbi:MAG TPA: DUF971 domain-containing protein [Chthoniobacterales bacterium]
MFGVRAGVKAFDVIGDDLAICWEDGSESYVPLRELRLRCPCAACAGEKDLLGREHRPSRNLTAKSFILTKVQRVGGYALQPSWADGHQTGLYSFTYLQSLTQAAE